MKRLGLAVLALVTVVALTGFAQTDCGCTSTTELDCYETYRSNEIIDFQLVIPVDYFWVHNVSIVPLITAWWVETLDGVVVKYVPFAEPTGHWATFSWDQSMDVGGYAEPGFYRLVAQTTYGEHVSSVVEVVSCCSSFRCCCPTPCCSCVCGPPICQPTCGELYLTVESGGTRSCCGFSLSISATFTGCCP